MTEYNKLNHWYRWNGGDQCPVHPKTIVDVILGRGLVTSDAGGFSWGDDDDPVIAFRTVREFKEPREFWVLFGIDGLADMVSDVPIKTPHAIRVREVIED